ncbi:hypothetical protein ACIRU3_36300 [Streptomyces sp. NPDC101151]|uniref:hypothetical protein n=1 Tax=Streptomyces sp. NPDC101151 TaxID=3366115 RepID=UPI00380DF4EF
MSGSPKYSTVAVASAYALREAQRRRQREEERRRQQKQRADQRAELAARRAQEAAARRERAKVEAARRKNELATRRAAEQEAHASRIHQEQAGADTRRLGEVRNLLAQARAAQPGAPVAELDALERQLDRLQEGIGRSEQLGGAIEDVRGRVVLLSRPGGTPAPGSDDRAAVLAGLEQRLALTGPDAPAYDPEGRRRCEELLDRLRDAAGPGAETRFEALLGTAEHALTRHAATVVQQADEERLRMQEARRQAEERAAAQAAAEEAERERAAAAEEAERERVAAALAEATDRLGVVHRSAEQAAAEAHDLADPDLAERIEAALRAATGALGTAVADYALRAVGALEGLLAGAEARLDELHLAHTRRSDLAEALQEAMLGEGFAFTGGGDRGDSVVLHFARPSGATYETTVVTEADGTPVLVYHVDGEPDVMLYPAPEGAVCDRTEDLLERVHEAIVEQDGFVPGELTWQGKPPGRQAKQLPGAEEWKWSR